MRKERIEDALKSMCDSVEERQKVVANLKTELSGLGLEITVPGGTSSGNGKAKQAAAAATAADGSTSSGRRGVAAADTSKSGGVAVQLMLAKIKAELGLEGSTEDMAKSAAAMLGLDARLDAETLIGQAHEELFGKNGPAAAKKGAGGAAGTSRDGADPAANDPAYVVPDLPPNIKACPACGVLIERNGGDSQMMCGSAARVAGGTYKEAMANGGCGHEFDWETLAPKGTGKPGEPANDRQVNFRFGN